ncbi:MAG: hypothetical protein CVV50_01920, partial [Spirochaetae bacterium HGW-Spirochaetae-6]
KLSVLDKGSVLETRNMINKMYWEKGKEKTLVRFLDGLKRNVTFYSEEKNDRDDNIQYIFIPGVGRPRQISSSEKQNDFEDTDMTNEDMGGRKVYDYRYERQKDASLKIGDETYQSYVLIAESKNKDARFPKIKFWIDQKSMIPVRANMYGRDQKLKRIGLAAKVKEFKPGIFMAQYMYVKDLEKNHETKMQAEKVVWDTPSLSANQFTPSNLSKPWSEQ